MVNRTLNCFCVFVALALAGCTVHNPASCFDGVCSDPTLPFCDTDGAISGTADSCISVVCAPDAFEACRGSQEIRCNGDGNDYNVTSCDNGCDATSGCKQCTSNDQCMTTAPICDSASSTCRQCIADAECASGICESGMCIPETSIAYASPDGSATAVCSQADPCSLDSAISAAATLTPPTIRMLPGTYPQDFAIMATAFTTTPINIVATGATLTGDSNFNANLSFRGVNDAATTAFAANVACSSAATGPVSRLAFRDSTFDHVNFSFGRCEVTITTTDLHKAGFFIGSNTTLVADQIRIHELSSLDYQQDQVGISTQITNSVLEDVDIITQIDASASPASHLTFAYDTIVFTAQDSQLVCSPTAGQAMHFEDSILVALAPPTSQPDVINGTSCVLQHNVLFPQPPGLANNILADPQFISATDFHLQPTSPAIDAAMPSTGLTTDHDFDGTARPQGPASDIGAYELKP
jgi:hypothetical protein